MSEPSNYFIVEDNVIVNVASALPEDAEAMGFYPVIEGKWIGDIYDDTKKSNTQLTEENKLLKAQVSALSDQNEFLEDCIVEMAGIVYDY